MMMWKTIIHSEVGTSHKKRQMPCQDYGHYELIDELKTIVGAVADGSGSAKHSEIGSKLAVDAVLSHLKEYLGEIDKNKRDLRQPISEEEAEKVFKLSLYRVLNVLETRSLASSYSLRELACTLIAFIATPDWIAAMQIGDGFIVVGSLENSKYQLLFKPSKGEYANQTTFVTSSHALSEMNVKVLASHKKFICASTDGLERVAINISDWTPGEIFFQPLEQYMQMNDIKQTEKYVINFLQSEKLNSRTDDDKTLLVCLYDEDINPQFSSSKTQDTEKLENSSFDSSSLPIEKTKQSLTNDIPFDKHTKTCVFPATENTDELEKSSVTSSSASEENDPNFLPKDVDSEGHTEQNSIPSEIADTGKLASSSAEIPHLSKENTENDQST